MLHRGSSNFFELLDQGGWPDDSGQQQIQDHLHAGETLVQDAYDVNDTRSTGEWNEFHV